MSLSESDKSAASCARRDSVLTCKGRSTVRSVWMFSRSSGGVANKSSAVQLPVRDRLVTVQFYRCHSSVGDCLGTIQCRHRHSVVGRLACHFASESVVIDIC